MPKSERAFTSPKIASFKCMTSYVLSNKIRFITVIVILLNFISYVSSTYHFVTSTCVHFLCLKICQFSLLMLRFCMDPETCFQMIYITNIGLLIFNCNNFVTKNSKFVMHIPQNVNLFSIE